MRPAYYESIGPAADVIRVGERPTPTRGSGEVRVRIHASGVNPSDVKARAGAREALAYPYVIPHSDGACLGIPAMTACHATLGDGLLPGKTVLVTGGADHVINYREQDVVAVVKELTAGAGVDRIVEVELGGTVIGSVVVAVE